MITSRPLAIVAALAALAAASPAAAQDIALYRSGKQNWLAAVYPAAYPPLYSYRGGPYGRTADVDYMLGTSACRIAARRAWGARMLNYILYAYPLPQASRAQVVAERDLCFSAGQLTALSISARRGVETMVGASASGRGKLFYGDALAAYPAHRLREIPLETFQARLVPIGQEARVREVLGPNVPAGIAVRVKGRFAFLVPTVGGQTDAELDRIAALLESYVGFLQRAYAMTPPTRYITIYLVNNTGDVRSVAEQVHGLDVSPATLGYTFQDDLSAVAMVRGDQAGTLLHELFHLLVRGSFGDAPQWLDEGYASLYEVSSVAGGRFAGEPNWRGGVLQQLGSMSPKLETLVASPWFSFDRADAGDRWDQDYSEEQVAAHLATARYFALYLQEQGALAKVYRAFQARDPGASDDPGQESVRIVERTLGKPIAQIQADYDRWSSGALDGRPSRATTASNVGPMNAARPNVVYDPKTSPPNAYDPKQALQANDPKNAAQNAYSNAPTQAPIHEHKPPTQQKM